MNEIEKWSCIPPKEERYYGEDMDMLGANGLLSWETLDSLEDFTDCIWDESRGGFMTVEQLAGLLEIKIFDDEGN